MSARFRRSRPEAISKEHLSGAVPYARRPEVEVTSPVECMGYSTGQGAFSQVSANRTHIEPPKGMSSSLKS